MIAIDREPVANIIQSASLSEDFIGGSASPIVPEAFNKAFTSEPLDFLHSIKSLTLPIGRNRFLSKITFGLSKIKDSLLDILRYKRVGRGRGPCTGCIAGTEDNHHGGSKCRKRGAQGLSLSQFSTGLKKVASKPLGFRF